jgi:hypothetical protein
MRHFPAGKKLSKEPDGRAPSDWKIARRKTKAVHAMSESSQRKGDKKTYRLYN